jgi:Uma2 family endonuclease
MERKLRMSTILDDGCVLEIPRWVVDLDSFRRWVDLDSFPEKQRVLYLKGEVLIDMSREQLFSHAMVKGQLAQVLGGIANQEKAGLYFCDGVLLTNVLADLSGKPDGSFLSFESLRSGKVRLVEGAEGGYVEIEGAADMVLEVISRSSVHKDTVLLPGAYWQAGINEYWLVDARKEPLRFDIYRHTAKGYVAIRRQAGWLRSAVFGKSFRLTRKVGPLGYPEFVLEVRD